MSERSNLANTLPRLWGLHNISGAKLAVYIGVSTQYVSMLVNDERVPTEERLAQIAGIFGIDPDRLLNARFEDLLPVEIADPDRYRETQKRIASLERKRRAAQQ